MMFSERYRWVAVAMSVLGAGLFPVQAEDFLFDDFNTPGVLAGSRPVLGGTWQARDAGAALTRRAGWLPIARGSAAALSSFAAVSGRQLYMGMALRVTMAPTSPWIIPVALAGDNPSAGDRVGRLFVSTAPGSGGFRLGVDNDEDHPTWWPVTLQPGQTYIVVVGYLENGAVDQTRLWVNPGSPASVSVAEPAEAVSTFVDGVELNVVAVSGAVELDWLVVTDQFAVAAGAQFPRAPAAQVQVKGAATRRTSAKSVPVRGTVTSRLALQAVEYRVNSGPWRKARGKRSWECRAALRAGRNVVAVRAVDTAGTRSKVVRVTVVRARVPAR